MTEVRYAVYLKGNPYKIGDFDNIDSAYSLIRQEEYDSRIYYGDFDPGKYEIVKYYR